MYCHFIKLSDLQTITCLIIICNGILSLCVKLIHCISYAVYLEVIVIYVNFFINENMLITIPNFTQWKIYYCNGIEQ